MQILQPNYRRSDDRGTLTDLRGEWKQANILEIKKGFSFGGHYHQNKTEIFYVVSGFVEFTITSSVSSGATFKAKSTLQQVLAAKEIIKVEPYDQHTLMALEDSVVVELLSEPFDEKDTFKYGEEK